MWRPSVSVPLPSSADESRPPLPTIPGRRRLVVGPSRQEEALTSYQEIVPGAGEWHPWPHSTAWRSAGESTWPTHRWGNIWLQNRRMEIKAQLHNLNIWWTDGEEDLPARTACPSETEMMKRTKLWAVMNWMCDVCLLLQMFTVDAHSHSSHTHVAGWH